MVAPREGDERSGYEVDVARAIAKRLGVDIERDAIEAGGLLLGDLGHAGAELHQGDMWLPVHLAPAGRAIITHNTFVGLDRSRALAEQHDLRLRVVLSTLVYIPGDKIGRMTPGMLRAEQGRSLHRYGPYTFGDMNVVEFTRIAR